MATTTNFGWETPDDTDLVKDGALAIRTLGSAIDTSMVDLKGGTTGQILSKTSNTDMDFTWINNDQGDITGVTAGTGLTGGGTSGAVTLTNDMATTITASGDIVVGTGSGTYDNLPIGTTGQVLTADTTVSPYKVKWASPSGSSFKGCYLYLTSDVTLSNNTITELTFGQEAFDTDAFHSTSTNTGRITIPAGLGGYYRFTARALLVGYTGNSATPWQVYIYKNGALTGGAFDQVYAANNNETWVCEINHIMNLSAGDYITAHVFQKSGANRTVEGVNIHGTAFMTEYLGA